MATTMGAICFFVFIAVGAGLESGPDSPSMGNGTCHEDDQSVLIQNRVGTIVATEEPPPSSFDAADQNHDDGIDNQEWKSAFGGVDQNHDDSIDKQEWKSAFGDTNPTVLPTQAPTQAPTQPATRAPTQAPATPTDPPSPPSFDSADLNHDDSVDKQEYKSAFGDSNSPTDPPTTTSGPANLPRDFDPQAPEWLLYHNYFRCIHNTPPLAWDNDVAAGAVTWAEKGQMKHSKCYKIPAPQGPAGENLAAGQNDIAAAVTAWYDESPEKGSGCGGHCTAVLWKKSTILGCSKKNTWNGNQPLYVCRYAKSAANFGRKSDAVNAQDMSKEPDCHGRYPVTKRWTGSSSRRRKGGSR